MRRMTSIMLIAAVALTSVAASANAGSSLGAGLHYLRAISDIDKNSDLSKDSFGILGSYMYSAPLLKFEGQVEYVFNYVGSDKGMWTPQAYVLVGGMIYGGAGIGIGYTDGDWQSDPFYALRAGVNLPLMAFSLDIYATYQFQNSDDLKNLNGEDLNSATLAAVIHF